MKKKNVMYEVNNGWVKWRGVKYVVGDQFIVINPNSAEQVTLNKQCTPVTVAAVSVKSNPIDIQEDEKKPEDEKSEEEKPADVEPEVATPTAGKKKKTKTHKGE